MLDLYGRQLSRAELLQRVGRLDQIAGITPSVLSDGRAQGVRALDVTTGAGLAFTVLLDRCLDIPRLSYNGRSLCWYSRNGIVGPQFYEPTDHGFLRSFTGGLVTTCGLRNFGSPCQVGEERLPLHGRIGNLPAESVTWGTTWDGDDCRFWIEGWVRESAVFGECLTLQRRIETRLGGTSLRITNTVRNEGWNQQGHMILFHMNVGFPLLDDGARLLVNPIDVRPRDEEAQKGLAVYDRFVAPQADFHEQVFILDLRADSEGYTSAAVINTQLDGGLGLRLRFRKAQLPWMMEWRQLGQGTYVVGLEPANCPTIEGRAEAEKRGTLPLLAPGEARQYEIDVAVLRGEQMAAVASSRDAVGGP
jgi:hypothetical protein